MTTFLNIIKISQQVDINKSKQNKMKLTLLIYLARLLIRIEISAKKIIIFINYITQKNLINCFIIDNLNKFENVKIYIVDKFQKEKFLIIIFNIVDNDRFIFFLNFNYLLSVVNCVQNNLIIVCN